MSGKVIRREEAYLAIGARCAIDWSDNEVKRKMQQKAGSRRGMGRRFHPKLRALLVNCSAS